MADHDPNPAITVTNDLVSELKVLIKRYNRLMDKYRKGNLSDKQVVYQISRTGRIIGEIGQELGNLKEIVEELPGDR